MLPGDGFRSQHDSIKWQVLDDLRDMGMPSSPEAYGIFAPHLPQVARDHYDRLPKRKRQGIVPDLLVTCRPRPTEPCRPLLAEVKTLHYGPSTYPESAERCRGVKRRAARIHAEYLQKARTLDRRWWGTAPDVQGPVEIKLRSFGEVRGLIFGSWGEASADVDWLLSEAVAVGARRHRRVRVAEDDEPDRLQQLLSGMLRRRWGMAALRANARLLLDRLAYVGSGAIAATRRREMAQFSHSSRLNGRGGGAPRVWSHRI